MSYHDIGNELVMYAVNYDEYINVIYCKYINDMLSSHILMDTTSNIIPEMSDSSVWGVGVGKRHNPIEIGSTIHIIQVHHSRKGSKYGWDINKKRIDFNKSNRNGNGNEHDVWLWNVCWITFIFE